MKVSRVSVCIALFTSVACAQDVPQDTAPAGGLTYLQKYLMGLDPTKADTDGDGVIDNLDGVPLDPDLIPPPVPEANYAVLDLTLAGLSASDLVSQMNNKCQLIGKYSGPAPFFGTKG
ncbi:MAG: hypothetical protein ABIP20_02295 [Chthoniobacteraceae bacterium]